MVDPLSAQKKVISFNYTLKNTAGDLLDSSFDGPMSFLSGIGQILPKLEIALLEMLIGQKKTVSLSADDAYGIPNPKMLMEVPATELAHLDIKEGGFLQLNLGEQLKVVQITKVTEEIITLDGNHPLAGQDLVFDVEMIDMRPATPEEISHGHAHGPGGHHHH